MNGTIAKGIIIVSVGSIVGFMAGFYAINFFDKPCVINGSIEVCQKSSAFKFLGLVGWEATSLVGLFVGFFIALSVYLYFTFRK